MVDGWQMRNKKTTKTNNSTSKKLVLNANAYRHGLVSSYQLTQIVMRLDVLREWGKMGQLVQNSHKTFSKSV